MKYGKSKVLICEIVGICQDILKTEISKSPVSSTDNTGYEIPEFDSFHWHPHKN